MTIRGNFLKIYGRRFSSCVGIRLDGYKNLCWALALMTIICIVPCTSFCQAPVADFSSDIVSGCKPIVVKFSGISSNTDSWSWDLGNGTITTAQNPVTTFLQAGTYTVKLTATNTSGSTVVQKTAYITVYDLPTIDFFSNDTAGCAPLVVHFADKSTGVSGALTQWEWAFGDGATSNLPNPDHTYASAGSYNVSLKATNNRGCSDVAFKSQYIKSGGSFTADFSSSVVPYCNAPVKVSFSNLSNGTDSLSYTWDFGDGTTSGSAYPIHDFSAFGDYNVSLIGVSAAGCRDTVTKVVAIAVKKVDFLGPQTICVASAVNFSVTSSPEPLFVTWKMGDGTFYNTKDITHTYPVAGTYTITLINDFGGCIDSVSKTVTVTVPSPSDFSSKDTVACKPPLQVHFSGTAQNAVSFAWDFGDLGTSDVRSPSHAYKTTGAFNVTLQVTDSAGCISKITKPAFIKIIPPLIHFLNAPVSGCAPFAYTPAYTIDHADSVVSYSWSFGDGGTSTDPNPTHLYSSAGAYTLTLIVKTLGGCRDTISVTNGVKVSANTGNTFDFNIDSSPACVNKDVKFSSNATGPNLAYKWYFGDYFSSGQKSPVHSYGDTGSYTVRLDVSFGGCTSSVIKTNAVIVVGPLSRYTFVKDCSEAGKVDFTNTSKNDKSAVWDFGDGGTSTDLNPMHVYTADSNYTVKLVAVNGCTDTSEQVIPIWLGKTTISASKNEVCKGDGVVFTVVHPRPDMIQSYNFNFTGNFADGFITTSSGVVNWVYRTTGTFKVTVITIDRFGCRDTAVISPFISVHGPSARFGVVKNFQCAGQVTNFIDSSLSNGNTSITSWEWNYGDGSVQDYTSPPFSHVYTVSGRYPVTLKVTDNLGCSDSLLQPDFITSYYATADFTSVDSFGCPGKVVRFTDRSVGPVFDRVWYFGDGTSSSDVNPLHIYSAVGTYTVKLVIVSAGGCVDSIIKTNYISLSYPTARFSLSDSVANCPPLQVTFTDSSQYVASYVWNLGDGSISTVQNPSANYFLPGKYDVQLVVTSPGGCKDSAAASILIAGPNGNISYSPVSGCIPVPANFKIQTTGAIYFTWDFGDGFTADGPDSSASHTYASGGKFLPKVLIRNKGGCSVPIVGKDTVYIEELFPKFTASTQIVCDTASVFFFDSSVSTGMLSYQWYFGDGSGSTLQNPAHSYQAPGKYSAKLVINSSLGCADSVTYTNFLEVFKLPVASIIAKDAECAGGVSFASQIVPDPLAPATDYSWRFGNGDSSLLATPPLQQFKAGSYTNYLTTTNSKGCSATVSKPLIVNPLPVLSLSADTTICLSDTIQLVVSGADTYSWTGTSNTISCTNCNNPLVYPRQPNLYRVTGKTTAGCLSEDSVEVKVVFPFTLQAAASYDICLGKSAQLKASGAPLYKWSPATALSSADIADPLATPVTTSLYTVAGFDSLGCFTDTAYVAVQVNSIPTVDLGRDITTSAGNRITLTPLVSPNVVSYSWSPSQFLSCTICSSPEATATSNISYVLKVTSDHGCTADDSLQITVTCGDAALFVPNTFSPNNDGSNDIFYIRAKGISYVSYFRIMSRTGETVFEKRNIAPNDLTSGWDGTYKGRNAETGVFIYYTEVICTNNQVLKYSGNVTLIR